jgi:aminoacylase
MARRSALRALVLAACAAAAAAAPKGDAAVERFRSYLRIRTAQPTPDYVAAAAFLKAQAIDIGRVPCRRDLALFPPCALARELTSVHVRCARLQVELIEYAPGKPHVLMVWPGSDPSLPSIMLNSHTDVVPAEASFWRRALGERCGRWFGADAGATPRRSHEPFDGEIDEQGRIFARGSQDMKCVGLQYLEAIRRLKAKVQTHASLCCAAAAVCLTLLRLAGLCAAAHGAGDLRAGRGDWRQRRHGRLRRVCALRRAQRRP